MKSRKVGDSYAKRAGRTGIFNSGPSDRDLADQIGSAQVLIGAVVSGSGGWGSKGEWGGGGLVGDAQSGTSGVVSTRVWVGWPLCGMRKPLEARVGLGRAWAGLATARGGLRGGASPARARRGCWGALQATLAG